MTLHVVAVGDRRATAQPSRLRAIARAIELADGADARVIGVGSSRTLALRAGLRVTDWMRDADACKALAGRLADDGACAYWNADGRTPFHHVHAAVEPPPVWEAVTGDDWNPGPGDPIIAWVGEPLAAVSALVAVEAFARALLVGAKARLIVPADAPDSVRAQALARDLGVDDRVWFMSDDTGLAALAGRAPVAVLAPDAHSTAGAAREASWALSAFAAAGCACLVCGDGAPDWACRVRSGSIEDLTLAIVDVLGCGERLEQLQRASLAQAACAPRWSADDARLVVSAACT